MVKEKSVIRFQSFNFKRIFLLALAVYIIWSIKLNLSNDETLLLEKISLNKLDEAEPIDHYENVNIKYCGEKICRFMFPYFIPEQETRANLHLRSLTYLARSLNRIMVLPNVGNSRMNCCAPFPFEFYYDLKGMKEMFPNITFMTQQTFQKWTKELLIKPDTLHTWFIEDGRNDSYSIRDHERMSIEKSERYKSNALRELCINQFNLNISNYTEFHTGIKGVGSNNFQYNMAKFIAENLQNVESPVILIRNRSRKQMFPKIMKPIPFAPHIIKQATELKNKLQPYYCIHWRMEQAIPTELPECARKLIKTIDYLKKTEGINSVYLATDYPISGSKSASQTFYKVEKYHHEAMLILNSTINFNTWVSLNAFEEFRKDKKYDSEFSSSGIHGILDKITCIQADYFLSGPRNCCRLQSSFTSLIGQERRDLITNGNKRIRNVITRWGTMERID
ncbi:11636_t:CDS:2 [Funneliformis geosporum]|uniref:GDP-fucose protein O-fucosyltransferase 2 n=1 Tax=Funneliformis geosporum TaxID=1117311 RepID=A0A9W4SFM4_9GLOM|nr:11636_t:CDS:2 [Funneliformis geosporum]